MHKYVIACAALLLLAPLCTVHAQVDPPRNGREALDRLPHDIEVIPGRVIVKFRREAEHLLGEHQAALPSLGPLLARYGVFKMTRMYPRHQSMFTADGGEIALQRMYLLEFGNEQDPMSVARALCNLPDVEYAEPEVVQYLSYEPNDPMLPQQYALAAISARQAWEISKGSEDIVIAIVDSGVRWTHEDLEANIWINPGEDINGDGKFTPEDLDGIDNDGNGYIDDIIGIDFVGPTGLSGGTYYDNDPSPTSTGNAHGTHVAGIAAATGDNGKGIVGLAFKCRIMPIKCAPDRYTTTITRGYDGIIYAADNGAHVINCSWGGSGYLLSQAERVAYAISKGAVVIAAAGNSGTETVNTPAAYPNVLSVANVGQGDKVHASSTFGAWVDVSAPGVDIVSCVSMSNFGYASYTGTSMASPYVAGLAGLVRSVFPDFTPEQVREQIRVTADTIDHLQNRWLRKKIGRGRINALRALTEEWPGVRLIEWSWSDAEYGNGNGIPEAGERLTVRMRWKNYLAPTSNAVIRLSSTNSRVTIEQGEFFAGRMETMGEISNDAAPFVLALEDVYAPNDNVDLVYTVEDGEYTDNGGVFFIQQPSYRDHDINDIQVTITSDGNIGYDDLSGVTGTGFRYKGNESVLFEGAFLVGGIVNKTPLVVDVARSTAQNQLRDLTAEYLYNIATPGGRSDQQGEGMFEDLGVSLANRLQTRVRLESFAYDKPGLSNIIFLKYFVHNISSNVQERLHAGLFFDWDIGANAQTDIAMFVDSLSMAISWDSTGTPRTRTHIGVLPLAGEYPVTYWGINNRDSDDSLRIGIYNGFTKAEKWKALSTGIIQPVTQITDVSFTIANSLGDVQPGDSVLIGFALIAGESVAEVIGSVPAARRMWDTLSMAYDPTHVGMAVHPGERSFTMQLMPNSITSSEGQVSLAFDASRSMSLQLRIHDVLGRMRSDLGRIDLFPGRSLRSIDVSSLPAGSYFLRAVGSDGQQVRPLRVLR
jgi:serine protease